jgi:hypothetical protein
MFGWVVAKVGLARLPMDMELMLPSSVSEPVESHVHCLRSALDDGVGEDSGGTLVVEFNWRRTLRMSHFLETGSHWDGVFGIDETGSCF